MFDPCFVSNVELECDYTSRGCESVLSSYRFKSSDELFDVADSFIGSPYSQDYWSLDVDAQEGIDCSRFVDKSYVDSGFEMPASRLTTVSMVDDTIMTNFFDEIECSNFKKGDVLVYRPPVESKRPGHVIIVKEPFGSKGGIISHSKGGVGVTEDAIIDLVSVYDRIDLKLEACWRHKQMVLE